MVAFIYLLLLIAVACAWGGWRHSAFRIFFVAFVLSIAWFLHHVTTSVGLTL